MQPKFTKGIPVLRLCVILVALFSFSPLTAQPGPVAHYPFNGDARDVSGNENHGTVEGATLTTDRFGNPDRAYYFDGGTDHIIFEANQNFQPQLPITLSTWILVEDRQPHFIFTNDDVGGRYSGVWLSIPNGRISGAFGDGGPIGPYTRRTQNGQTTLAQDTWYHVAAIMWEDGRNEIYINGIFDCGTNSGSGGAMEYLTSKGRAGGRINTATGHTYFKGKMDDIRMYDRALEVSEIEELAGLSKLILCEGDSLSLDGGSSSHFTYQWSPPTGLSCADCPDPIAYPTDATEYTLFRTDDRGCESETNMTLEVMDCSELPDNESPPYFDPELDKGSNLIGADIKTEAPPGLIIMANIFTPNDDQINDRFLPVEVEDLNQPVLRVYDRWGRLCYESRNLDSGWDGTLNGRPCKEGVYYWVCEYQSSGGNIFRERGNVTLLR